MPEDGQKQHILAARDIFQLEYLIENVPIIDNHAHPLIEAPGGHNEKTIEELRSKGLDLLSVTSEAAGDALKNHARDTLVYQQAVRNLNKFSTSIGRGFVETWEDWEKVRGLLSEEVLVKKAFGGLQTILIDDGLRPPKGLKLKENIWHDQFLVSKSKRILRIEYAAEEILAKTPDWIHDWSTTWINKWTNFLKLFALEIAAACKNPEIVGFKSVIAYRTGLAIDGKEEFPEDAIKKMLVRGIENGGVYRIDEKPVNDLLVHLALDVIAEEGVRNAASNKPIQFHTGFGDNDILLHLSDPALLQSFIKKYPTITFVLLHGSYPYTREAGYLASVYENVYLDFGLTNILLSREGQITVIRQLLELVPSSKAMWSTDGHFFPETYYLALKNGRDALKSVMRELYKNEDIAISKLSSIVVDFMFNTANRVYKLGLEFDFWSEPTGEIYTYLDVVPISEAHWNSLLRVEKLILRMRLGDSLPWSLIEKRLKEDGEAVIDATEIRSRLDWISGGSNRIPNRFPGDSGCGIYEVSEQEVHPESTPDADNDGEKSLALLEAFIERPQRVNYVRINWVDYSAILRTRILTVEHITSQLKDNIDGSVIGLTRAGLSILANCMPGPGFNAVGEYRVVPDFTNIFNHPHIHGDFTNGGQQLINRSHHISVMCYVRGEQGEESLCPRNALASALSQAKSAGIDNIKVGFEIEFCMFKQSELDKGDIDPIKRQHTWTTSMSMQNQALDILEEIEQKLRLADIVLEQFHSEAAQGQYEICLPPSEPMKAVDTLIFAREVIQYTCAKYGYRASLIPKPFAMECGTGSHMHISVKPPEKQWAFFGGVVSNLPAISAFTLGGLMSYERTFGGAWAGGVWVSWGKQNRETPLRQISEEGAHWEVKCFDGLANAYLGAAAVISAGALGLKNSLDLRSVVEGTNLDPNSMSVEQREASKITTKMPTTLDEALEALEESNSEFKDAMGNAIVKHWAGMKRAEVQHLYKQFEDKNTGQIDLHRRKVWTAQWH